MYSDDDDDSEMELEEKIGQEPTEKSANIPEQNSAKKSEGKFHHRLATDKDTETHSKVLEALATINKKKEKIKIEEEEEESEEESEDEGPDNSDGM